MESNSSRPSNYAASERRVCGLIGMAVSSYRYASKRTDEPLRTKLVTLAGKKPRFGYRRLHVLLRRTGEHVNHKRLHRIYCEAGLRIQRKKRKHCVREGKPLVARMLEQIVSGRGQPKAIFIDNLERLKLVTRNNIPLSVETDHIVNSMPPGNHLCLWALGKAFVKACRLPKMKAEN